MTASRQERHKERAARLGREAAERRAAAEQRAAAAAERAEAAAAEGRTNRSFVDGELGKLADGEDR